MNAHSHAALNAALNAAHAHRGPPLSILLLAALLLPCACLGDDDPTRDASAPGQDGRVTSREARSGPFIEITGPTAGARWKVGTEQLIEWETDLEDVALAYSSDGGATWKKISDSIDTTSPHWRRYPWEVPAEPTAGASIEVKGYSGEVPTRSELFSIVE